MDTHSASRIFPFETLIVSCFSILLSLVPGYLMAGDHGDDDDHHVPPSENVIAFHDRNSPQYNEHCNDCHADIHGRQSLNPAIPPAHLVMFNFAAGQPGGDQQCAWCHRSVDLVQAAGSAKEMTGRLRKHVDTALCALCHGPQGPGKPFYQVGLSQLRSDGGDLYELVCSGCHNVISNSEVRGEDAADIEEAIMENEGGMAPLQVLTTEQIQAIAAALAQ